MVESIEVTEPLLSLQCSLGEGCVWDSTTSRLFFVDIDKQRVYTYEPSTGVYGFETFEEPISALVLRRDNPGIVATARFSYVLLTEQDLPFPPTSSTQPRKLLRHLTQPLDDDVVKATERFNDGSCDPHGRFWAGVMGIPEEMRGVLYVLDALDEGQKLEHIVEGKLPKLVPQRKKEHIGISNGMAWLPPDYKQMLHTDSVTREITRYDVSEDGTLSNPGLFFKEASSAEGMIPDGCCQDAQGGMWCARFHGAKVTRINTNTGQVDFEIHFPSCWNLTCCVWGGDQLEDLYVTSAYCNNANSRPQSEFPHSGDLFVVRGLGKRFAAVDKPRYNG